MGQVIRTVDQLNFTIREIPSMPLPKHVMMVEPTYFSVDYIINPHMANNVGKVDQQEARFQWNVLKESFEEIGLKVHLVEAQQGLPDMVFCANQSLPVIDNDDDRHAIMSIMHSDQRKKEVPYIEQWYRQNGYVIHHLDQDSIKDFEGCGDAIWHTGRQLLWGGYGYRSSVEAYQVISEKLDIPIIALELVDESFYHLDTCLCVLDEKTALIYPSAFTDQGLQMINTVFSRVINAKEQEAKKLFACNATCPDGNNVIIQRGCTNTVDKLQESGFTVHEIDTSEYLKSGGSVFCMKQLLW